jgi:hypothetical protein
MNHEGSSFLSGCAPLADFMFFSKQSDQLVDEGQSNSSFFSYDEDEKDDPFRKYDVSTSWVAIAMATIKPVNKGLREVISVAPDGEYWELEPLSTDEYIGVIKQIRGFIRAAIVINDTVYCCGMARTVLKRLGRDNWLEFGPADSNEKGVFGFEDIAGFNENDIYTVGWRGEIWHFNGSDWRQIDSTVSTRLSSICCAEDGFVYIVGVNGVMLKGRNESWIIIETNCKENLIDVEFYQEQIYVVTDFEILKLNQNGLKKDTEFSTKDKPSTCLHLLKAKDAIFSMGTKDLWRKKTLNWERIV